MTNQTTWRRGVKHQAGAANNAAKLTEMKVRFIRNSPSSNSVVAELLGVSRDHVARIRARKIWKHVA